MLKTVLSLVKKARNIIMVAPGGAGKSYTIVQAYEEMIKSYGPLEHGVMVTALTGCACVALNDQFGYPVCRTLHSALKIGCADTPVYKRIRWLSKEDRERIIYLRWLIIDEVSMLGADLLAYIDLWLRTVRESNAPLGGVRVLLSGDFMQLPPINDDYCFESDMWASLKIAKVTTEEIYRFKDKAWQELLSRVRTVCTMTKDDHIYLDTLSEDKVDWYNSGQYMLLFARNADVDAYNTTRFRSIRLPVTSYVAQDNLPGLCQKIFNKIIPSVIMLKPGAFVRLTRNLDVAKGLINGSQGVILTCNPSSVTVKFITVDDPVRVEPMQYTVPIEDGKKDEFYIRQQLPITLSWAGTIHKAQGATVNRMVVDMYNVEQVGQAYVALSRAPLPSCIVVRNYSPDCIAADAAALKYCS